MPSRHSAYGITRDPRHAEAAFLLGTSLSRLGELRKAVRACARAADLKARNAPARSGWGCCLVHLNRPDEAEGPLRDAV